MFRQPSRNRDLWGCYNLKFVTSSISSLCQDVSQQWRRYCTFDSVCAIKCYVTFSPSLGFLLSSKWSHWSTRNSYREPIAFISVLGHSDTYGRANNVLKTYWRLEVCRIHNAHPFRCCLKSSILNAIKIQEIKSFNFSVAKSFTNSTSNQCHLQRKLSLCLALPVEPLPKLHYLIIIDSDSEQGTKVVQSPGLWPKIRHSMSEVLLETRYPHEPIHLSKLASRSFKQMAWKKMRS